VSRGEENPIIKGEVREGRGRKKERELKGGDKKAWRGGVQ